MRRTSACLLIFALALILLAPTAYAVDIEAADGFFAHVSDMAETFIKLVRILCIASVFGFAAAGFLNQNDKKKYFLAGIAAIVALATTQVSQAMEFLAGAGAMLP